MDEIFGLDYAGYFTNAIPVSEIKVTGSGYNTVVSVNDLSDLFAGVGNTPPTAQDFTVARAANLSLKLNIADLLAGHTADADGDPRALRSLGASAQGATIGTNLTQILYDPANNNADTFSYTITDGRGGNATARIDVLVVNPGGIGQSGSAVNGVVTVNFAAIPGFDYDVQQSTNLVDWTVKGTFTAPVNGMFQFTESNAPSPSFYRLMQH